jgi:hypothetical protein
VDTITPTTNTADTTITESDQPKGWRAVLPVHPAAELFPLMSAAELRELADDIKKHGLAEPVSLYDDRELGPCLLDGRNRLDALELLDWEAGDLAYEPPSERNPVPCRLLHFCRCRSSRPCTASHRRSLCVLVRRRASDRQRANSGENV